MLLSLAVPAAQVGTVRSEAKISETAGGFEGVLDPSDHFGALELALDAPQDDDGGIAQGALWILFLNPAGTVETEQKLSTTSWRTLPARARLTNALEGVLGF